MTTDTTRFTELESEGTVINDPTRARLNITWARMNGDLPDSVSRDASDADVKQIAAEAVRTGYIPGITADPDVDFTDYVVERFDADGDLPHRVMLRPKTEFGNV